MNRKKELKQYFTPRRIVQFIIDFLLLLKPELSGAMPVSLIDPSCGEGVFIEEALKRGITSEKLFRGIDRDPVMKRKWMNPGFLQGLEERLIISDGLFYDENESFDLVLGNPPFGVVELNHAFRVYEDEFQLFRIFHQIHSRRKSRTFPVEVLFLEKFVKLLKPGGTAAIILPEGIFTNSGMEYIRNWLVEKCAILALISLKKKIFLSSGASANTRILFFSRLSHGMENKQKKVFWGLAREIELHSNKKDHLDELLNVFLKGENIENTDFSGFFLPCDELSCGRWDNGFNNSVYTGLYSKIREGGWPVVPLGELIGPDDIRSAYKGPQERSRPINPVPYISSQIVGRVGIDLAKNRSFIERYGVSDVSRTRLKEDHILLVRSGEGCIGRCVVAGEREEGANVRSEIYVIKTDRKKINPYYLALFFNSFLTPYKGVNDSGHKAHFQICRIAGGVGTPNLNKNEILSFQVPVLSMEFQNDLEARYKKIRSMLYSPSAQKQQGDCRSRSDACRTEEINQKMYLLIKRTEDYIRKGIAQ